MNQAIPLHFGSPASPAFGWMHPPREGARQSAMGVVVCNTLGNESLRLHGSLRHLAERLAGAGIAALRFDYRGTGDSYDAREKLAGEQVSVWREDIRAAIRELRARAGVSRIGLFGVRLGATLALAAAAQEAESEPGVAVESLILWEPCLSGKDFISESRRQHRVFESMFPQGFTLNRRDVAGQPVATTGMEAMGFSMNGLTLEALGKLEPLAFATKSASRILLIGAAAPGAGLKAPRAAQALLDRLDGTGARAEYRQCAGFQAIFRHLQKSDIAGSVHDLVLKWLDGSSTASRDGVAGHREISAPAPRMISPGALEWPFLETPVFFGPDQELFGILTTPVAPVDRDGLPAVIIVNAGVGTRIGPHRLYVEMARRWASLGFAVLRADLAGSGDSRAPEGQSECDPYPPSALADIARAMDFLESRVGSRRFIVAGICSGADLAFRAAAENDRVACSLVINPRSFHAYNFPDLELHVRALRSRSQVRDREQWLKLVRMAVGDQGPGVALRKCLAIGASVLHRLARKLGAALRNRGSRASASFSVRDIPRAFHDALARGTRILLFVSRGDPGVEYVDHYLGREMRALGRHPGFRRIDLDGTDHLFTLQYAREQVIERITAYLRESL